MREEILKCFRCHQTPDQLDEYQEGYCWEIGEYLDAEDYCRNEEGTYNPQFNTFCCTNCYIDIGCPSSRHGWKAPKPDSE